ncbi:Ppx/GppA phosphatase family protein [Methanospirillum lacunae]|uniref:Ppx/GppA family phosphatase n=1 Tax=Methanospirillum lacunae TaxID=668570 RepID=A0A2V2MYK7_9EURY|nr:Ppx/GppA phosphatase family protein [Methanospirillum lacunae]PWR73022.1 hypothetical protein DK846_05415 [Methanospirillum lacunae]
MAVATSALREAENRNDLIDPIFSDTGVSIKVISGAEEARLIWLGVRSMIRNKRTKTLFIDIGGGSTEVSIGDVNDLLFSCSLKLGAIRTTQAVVSAGYQKPYTSIIFESLNSTILEELGCIIPELEKHSCFQAYGSSGTILALESIARNVSVTSSAHIQGILTIQELKQIIRFLGKIPLDDRRKVDGLNPARADIIIAGACILMAILEKAEVQKVQVTSYGLRDGLLQEYLLTKVDPGAMEIGPTRQNIIQEVGEIFRIDVSHADRVRNIAVMLYESGKEIHLFNLPDCSLELLMHAAYLHDIGHIVSYPKHHYHTYYLIRSLHLPEFSNEEKEIIALIARYHRKKVAREKDEPFLKLCKSHQKMVKMLSYLLRIAEILDRSHYGRISRVTFNNLTNKAITLNIECPDDISLELTGINDDKGLFKKIFGVELRTTISQLSQNDIIHSVSSELTS